MVAISVLVNDQKNVGVDGMNIQMENVDQNGRLFLSPRICPSGLKKPVPSANFRIDGKAIVVVKARVLYIYFTILSEINKSREHGEIQFHFFNDLFYTIFLLFYI